MRTLAAAIVICVMLSPALDAAGKSPRRVKRARHIAVEVTAYCIDGETKSGARTRKGVAAADPAVLPIGSLVRIEGLRGRYSGTYTVLDTGRTIKGREIDIFVSSCRAARRFGRQRALLHVLRRGPNLEAMKETR